MPRRIKSTRSDICGAAYKSFFSSKSAANHEDQFCFRPRYSDVQPLSAEDKRAFGECEFWIGHCIGSNDCIAFLALHPIYGFHDTIAAVGFVFKSRANRDILCTMRADDRESVTPECFCRQRRLVRCRQHAIPELFGESSRQADFKSVVGAGNRAVVEKNANWILRVQRDLFPVCQSVRPVGTQLKAGL